MTAAIEQNEIGCVNWERNYRLGDGCTVKHGFAFKGSMMTTEDCDDLPIVVNIVNFQYTGGFRFGSTKVQRYTGSFRDEYILSPGDVLLVMTCQTAGGEILGIPGRIPDDGSTYAHNQRMGLIQVYDGDVLDLGFLYYLSLSQEFNAHLCATATGSKILHTSPSRIENFRFARPPLPTQRKIAAILSAYDDLIENNTRRIAILEELAQSLYREWFVHYRYPGHEHVPLIDSGTPLGLVPEGWELKNVSDVANVLRGRSYKSSELVESGGFPFINLKCIDRDGGFRVSGLKRYQGQYRTSHQITPGNIVMAVTDMTQERRIVARAARVPDFGEPLAVMSMDLVRIEPHVGISQEYLYGMFRYSGFADEVKQHANGANVLHLSPQRIEAFEFPLAAASVRDEYGEIAASIYSETDVLHKKNDVLRRTRDLLLPKLISGEVNVVNIGVADVS